MKHCHKINPSGRWWLKADATDIQVGLRESMRNEWAGDVDFGDSALQEKHKEYLSYLQFISKLEKKGPSLLLDLQKLETSLDQERAFLKQGHMLPKSRCTMARELK